MADNKVITVGPLLMPKRKNILVQTNVLKSVGGFFTNGRLPYYFLYEQKKGFFLKMEHEQRRHIRLRQMAWRHKQISASLADKNVLAQTRSSER